MPNPSQSSSSNTTVEQPYEFDSITPAPPENPFATPYESTVPSRNASSTGLPTAPPRPYFHSRRIKKGSIEKPWLKHKDPREKWVTIIPLTGLFIGLLLAGFLIWDGLRTVVNHKYCPVLLEDFSSSQTLNPSVWTQEAEVGGFGNGEFEETTTGTENVFIANNMLHIRPTLQDPDLINHNTTIDLRKTGTCTSKIWSNCIATTNVANGTIIPPTRSGRINTRAGATIKYGRIEVTAKLPRGDWLWPAIWLLPVSSTYGPWPRSGEIDIAESRGNNHSYTGGTGGNDMIASTLHWGPDAANDAFWRTNVARRALHTTFAEKFHTFGLEWSERYLFTYIDTRLLQVLYVNFPPRGKGMWARGNFPLADGNGSAVVDPWSQTGRANTPFDEEFYLVLNVAVGGTNGWFADGVGGKPWVDGSESARLDFWNARAEWYPTWRRGEGEKGGLAGEMVVKSVKMWQQEGYNGC